MNNQNNMGNGGMNSLGDSNIGGNPNNMNRPQGNRQINVQPNQVSQLVQALKNEVALAKASTDDPVKQQQHYSKAESIRQILLNYQAQQRARMQQQQQQQQQQPQQQRPQQPMQNQQVPNTTRSPAMAAAQHAQQAFQAKNQSAQSPMNMQQGRLSAQATPVMPSPGLHQSSNMVRQSPVMQQQVRQSPLMQQPQPFQGQSSQSSSHPQQQVQQQFQQQMRSNNSQAPTPSANPAAMGTPAIPPNAVTVERFNQVKQRLQEVGRKIQILQQSKKGNVTTEQSALIDREITDLKAKFAQFQRVGIIMRNQLVQQVKGNAGDTGATPTGSGSVTANGSTSGSPMNVNSVPTPSASQNQNQFIPQQNLNAVNSPAMSNLGVSQQRPAPQVSQIQQVQQQAQRILQQQQRTPGSTPQLPQAAPNQPSAAPSSQAQSPIGFSSTTSQPQRPSSSAGVAPEVKPSPPVVTPANAAASANAANAASETKTGSPSKEDASSSKPQTPSQSIRSSEPPPINLSGITKPSVPSIPISSTINVKPPVAVTYKANEDIRPSLTGGAASSLGSFLNTPAVTKLPMFDLSNNGSASNLPETGGRVFTKRKLTELVNTTGVDEGDGKTNMDGNVEELLLDLADEFINSVTSFACRLAKHRKVDTIDAKDVQLHLERNWNIRIPGYAMDEIRSTRKLQPTASYNQKVSGVEISKSVNGNIA